MVLLLLVQEGLCAEKAPAILPSHAVKVGGISVSAACGKV
jgi:hypothetical protein